MASSFLPFNPRAGFQATHRNLPHWQQPGVVYFVTFRLFDSLPRTVLKRLAEIQHLNDREAFAWVERFLDAGSGACLFRNPVHATVVAAALRHFDGMRYSLGAFVVMPNHVHALVQPIAPATLTSVLHSWKSHTAHALQQQAGIRGRVWQEESFDRIVRDANELRKFHDYILANPTAAHLPAETFILGQGSAAWNELGR